MRRTAFPTEIWAADLGAETGNLTSMGLHLRQAIGESLAGSPDVLKQVEKISPALGAHLKITRQWDRLVQLDRRLSEGTCRGSCSPNVDKPTALAPPQAASAV